ncbi:hypothetical protein [Thermus thermophilus]|uniref:hypothetical protein n=1 Tax=Thermus thermophilus TaxID=274 RepID=UPI001CC4F8E1|nr:hypothetical protein [Thermus thermophilus]BDB11840.1 hypothetical protein TthTMY_15790 [Thermus thermophilus]
MKGNARFLSLLALLSLSALAQPGPPPPGNPPPPPAAPQAAPYQDYRHMVRAQREVARAQYLAGLVRPSPLKGEADGLLRWAQGLQTQDPFRAKELAAAAANIYEGLLLVEGAPYPPVPRGPEGWSRAYEAPYRAQEAIARTEMEAVYYRVNNPLVRRLLEEAKRLLSQGNDLAKAEAAHRLARAAHHLIKAERGF